jgi:CheY-like chemotaxis protein
VKSLFTGSVLMKLNRTFVSGTSLLTICFLCPGHPDASSRVFRDSTETAMAFATLPDLIVLAVDTDNLDGGEVKVKIRNQGQRPAWRSDVLLTMTWGSKTASFVRTDSGQLAGGQTDVVTFDVKASLVQAEFCATVDSLKRIKEGDETNNKLCGQFEGKP